MTTFLAQYAGVLVVFLVLDGVWLGLVAGRFYRAELGPLMREDVLWPVAIGFYAVYAVGVVVLAAGRPGPDAGWWTPALYGALLGLVAYGTYDLTNLATLKGFSSTLAAVDLAWGTTLTAIAATAGWWVGRLATG